MLRQTQSRTPLSRTAFIQLLQCCEQLQKAEHHSKSPLEPLPILVRPIRKAGLLRARLPSRMGISSSRPPLAPHGGNTHEEWRAEAKKHAEARNALFQQSQVLLHPPLHCQMRWQGCNLWQGTWSLHVSGMRPLEMPSLVHAGSLQGRQEGRGEAAVGQGKGATPAMILRSPQTLTKTL